MNKFTRLTYYIRNGITIKIPQITVFSFYKKSFATKHKPKFNQDGFPKSTSEEVYPEDELIFDIKETEKFKGMLIICPTPIGNLNDITIRQYEAIKIADILACEDSRVTSKLIEQISKKKMKEMFYMEFGISFDDFVNQGGMDMSDDKIEEMFIKEKKAKETSEVNTEPKESIADPTSSNYYTFYQSNEDKIKIKNIDEKLKRIDEKLKAQYLNTTKQKEVIEINNEKEIENLEKKLFSKFSVKEKTFLQFFSEKKAEIEKEYEAYINELTLKDKAITEKKLENDYLTNEIITKVNDYLVDCKRNIVDINSLDLYHCDSHIYSKEGVADYTRKVNESSEFFTNELIDFNNKLSTIESIADDYFNNKSLSFKLRNKAKYIMGINRNLYNESSSTEDNTDEYLDLESGLEDNAYYAFKKKESN